MIYRNTTTGQMYYGGSLTINANGVLFSGIPTTEQLESWGFEKFVLPPTPEPPEPTPEDELDAYEALQIITGGIEE